MLSVLYMIVLWGFPLSLPIRVPRDTTVRQAPSSGTSPRLTDAAGEPTSQLKILPVYELEYVRHELFVVAPAEEIET